MKKVGWRSIHCSHLELKKSFSNDHNSAIEDFSKFIETNPEFNKIETIYVFRGTAYDKIGDYRAFWLAFKKAIEINPLNANTFFTQVHIFEGIMEYTEAIKSYSKSLEINQKKWICILMPRKYIVPA